MKIPFSWLKEHTPLTKSATEVADDLVRLGHEVEGIIEPRAAIKGVRVGLITSILPHPDADKLKLLVIDIGESEPLNIVCGAGNMVEGDKIPVATLGTKLPNGLKIKKGKIRGQTSFGMCCSEEELGLAESADGLLILPADAPIGDEVGVYLAFEEAILDLDITPNRGDCMSARGLARDLAADDDLPFIEADALTIESDAAVAAPTVSLSAHDDCPLYSARLIQDIRVTCSPDWLQARLVAAGLRPINGVVDVINYTMLDLGQPMHAFDANTLNGGIQVRHAVLNEHFLALDGREVLLQAGDLVIADADKVIALAGIMGSEATGVTDKTTSIILESAAFKAAKISTTRRTCGLVSDSSMRFERGVDPAMIEVAMDQVTALLCDLFGGKISVTTVLGDTAALFKNKVITVDMQRIESRLGIAVPAHAHAVLGRMGFTFEGDKDAVFQVSVPSHRHDVSLWEDISEEYARVIGFEHIPALLPSLATIKPRQVDTCMSSAVSLGFVQVINYAFISPAEQRLFVADDGQDLVLQNPISAEMSVMRRSVFPSLMNNAKYNMNRQQAGVALVEQGRIYAASEAGAFAENHQESNVMAWLMAGDVATDEWFAKTSKADFFDLKGAVVSWLQSRGLTARFMANDTLLGLQAGQTANIVVGKTVVGHMGKVDADLAAHFDLDVDVFVAQINVDVLSAGKKAKFQAVAEFPLVERDLVFLVDCVTTAEDMIQTARKAGGKLLINARIFDLYEGQGVPEGKVSLGIRFALQDRQRTLTQEDSDAVSQAIITAMTKQFAAELRA